MDTDTHGRRRACEINNAQERGHSCPLTCEMALTPNWRTCSSRQEHIESGLITRFEERRAQTVRQARCRLQAHDAGYRGHVPA